MANLGVQMQERPTQGLLHLGFSLSPDSPGPPVQGRSLLNRKRYWNGSRHLGLEAKVFPLEENCNAKISPFEAKAYAVLFKHQLESLPTHVCVLHMLLCTHGERGLAGSFSAVSIFVCWKKLWTKWLPLKILLTATNFPDTSTSWENHHELGVNLGI